MKAIDYELRPIRKEDNMQVATVIKDVMTAYECVGEGYSITDPELEDMYAAYNDDRSAFFVIAHGDKIYGCGGIGPLVGGDKGTCELKKMYFYPEIRGRGLGKAMMDVCIAAARDKGYSLCYLETVERMARANVLYNKYGFNKLKSQSGSTGHCGCDTFYAKEL